jgi:hypothetical protein
LPIKVIASCDCDRALSSMHHFIIHETSDNSVKACIRCDPAKSFLALLRPEKSLYGQRKVGNISSSITRDDGPLHVISNASACLDFWNHNPGQLDTILAATLVSR